MSKRKHQPIEPKPTQYGRTLFRSRLEARWAVFLDFTPNVLNWEYEPKTFKLLNGWEYTPDFEIRLFQENGTRRTLYLEVKPLPPTNYYAKSLLMCIAEHDIMLVLAVGDFYKPNGLYLQILGDNSRDIFNLFTTPERGAYHAANFRFDLKG